MVEEGDRRACCETKTWPLEDRQADFAWVVARLAGDAIRLHQERLDQTAAAIRGAGGERVLTRAGDAFCGLDVLVSNAGVMPIGPLEALATDSWMEMVDVNLKGVVNGIAAALPVFLRQGRGHFVNTASTAARKVVPGQAVYTATKAAVLALSEGLRQELTGRVRVTVVSPGFTAKNFVDQIRDSARAWRPHARRWRCRPTWSQGRSPTTRSSQCRGDRGAPNRPALTSDVDSRLVRRVRETGRGSRAPGIGVRAHQNSGVCDLIALFMVRPYSGASMWTPIAYLASPKVAA